MNKKHITVVGIFVVDISVYSKKLPLPGETVIGDTYNIGPGGKGSNQAVAIAKAGGEVSLIARIGNDGFGKVGQKLYDDTGVKKNGLIIENNEKTGCATISVDEAGMNAILVVPSSANGLSPELVHSKREIIRTSQIESRPTFSSSSNICFLKIFHFLGLLKTLDINVKYCPRCLSSLCIFLKNK